MACIMSASDETHDRRPCLGLGDLERCSAYLEGIAHFEAGRFFEAHEAWEQPWRGLRARRIAAEDEAALARDFLKALIKLAAAGVATRAGRQRAASHHADSARALLAHVAQQGPDVGPRSSVALLDLGSLVGVANDLAAGTLANLHAAVRERPIR